jgi:propane monooxygenase small subunit
MLADDEQHGAENKQTMQRWLEDWSAQAFAAARQLQPIWSQISEKVIRFEESLDRSRGRLDSMVSDIGLETPKEVKS